MILEHNGCTPLKCHLTLDKNYIVDKSFYFWIFQIMDRYSTLGT